MELSKQNSRVCLFDNLKFLLILLVVVGHFADCVPGNPPAYKSIFIFIYAFHMPLFLFCSGMFHSNKNIFIKVLRYISVGFATKMIFALTELLPGGNIYFKLLSDNGIPWYMFVLAIYVTVTYALRHVDKRFLLVFSILLACFVGYDSSISDYLYISRVVVFYPFYLCGQLISKQDILKINTNKVLKALGALILLIWLVLSITNADLLTVLRPLFTGRNSFSSDELFVKWGFLYRLLCYLITSLLCFAVITVMPGRRIPLVSDYGTKTLQVYFWHWPFVRLLQLTGAEEALMNSGFGMTLWILIGVALTFILSTKPFSFPTKQIFKYCRYQPDSDKAPN